jgi:predicted AAA+ superfamily ATPase
MQSDKQLIPRKLLRNIKERLFRNKAIIIYGPRQVGKTTLVNSLFSDLAIKEQDYRYLNGDDFDVREMLSKPNIVKLEGIIGKSKIVFIDEAQRIPACCLKIL